MTAALVDATTLIALGQVGELPLLLNLDAAPVVLPAVEREVTTEPARTNVRRFRERERVVGPPALPFSADGPDDAVRDDVQTAREMLGDVEYSGDVELVAAVYRDTRLEPGRPDRVVPGVDPSGGRGGRGTVSVVSDDRRVRTVARGFGATVTRTVGVVVRSVEERDLTADEAATLVRRLDGRGLHMTAELRETALALVKEAADGSTE